MVLSFFVFNTYNWKRKLEVESRWPRSPIILKEY